MIHLSVAAVVILIAVTHLDAQNLPLSTVELTSTLDQHNAACPGELVVFTCKIIGSLVMWESPTLIGNDSIQFSSPSAQEVGLGIVRFLPNGQDTFAQLINQDNGTITSELRVVVPEDADDTYSLLVICKRGDISPQQSNHRVAGTINPPHINEPILLHYDSETNTSLYNISWNPPKDSILIDIHHYEIHVGSLITSTGDTYMVVNITSNADIAITISVVDRCGRRQSTVMIFPPVIPAAPDNHDNVGADIVNGYISIGYMLSFVGLIFTFIRMILTFRYVEKLLYYSMLGLFMVLGAIFSGIFCFSSLCLLIASSAIQAERNSTVQHKLILTSLYSSFALVAIELSAMMVLAYIMYTRLRDGTVKSMARNGSRSEVTNSITEVKNY